MFKQPFQTRSSSQLRALSGQISLSRLLVYALGFLLTVSAGFASAQSAFNSTSLNVAWDEDPSMQDVQLQSLNISLQQALNANAQDFCFVLATKPESIFELPAKNCSTSEDSSTLDGYSPSSNAVFGLILGTMAIDYDSRAAHELLLVSNLRDTTSTRTANRLKVAFTITNFDETPALVDQDYAYAPPDSQSKTVHYLEVDDQVTLSASQVFSDPEGGYVRLLQDTVELCYTGEPGNFIGSANSCYDLDSIPTPAEVFSIVVRGPQLIATADGANLTAGGVYWANLSFGVADPNNNRADGDARATITLFVKRGVNNPPMFRGGATGFTKSVSEVKDDYTAAVPIIPDPEGSWDATDLDSSSGSSTHGDTISYRLLNTQVLCNGMITAAVAVGDMCIKLVLSNSNAGTGVGLHGYFLDYESPSLSANKDFTVVLRASDGWNHEEIPITIALIDVNEFYAHSDSTTHAVMPTNVRVIQGQSRSFNLQSYFTDPEMEEIAFTATGSVPGLSSLTGSQLTIHGTGTTADNPNLRADVYIQATDGQTTIDRTIQVDVRLANQAPRFLPVGVRRLAAHIDENVALGTATNLLIQYEDADSTADEISVDLSTSTFSAVVEPYWDGTQICSADRLECTRQLNHIAIVANESLNHEQIDAYLVEVGLHDGWTSSNPANDIELAITVNDVNDPPMSIGQIPPQTVSVQATVELSVGQFFSDEDQGDRVSVSAVAGNTRIVRVGTSGFDGLSLTGVDLGSTEITVTGTDENGATASQKFQVTVVQNQRPVVNSNAFDDALPTNLEMLLNEIHEVPLLTLFDDPDGDSISVEVDSSNPDVVLLSITGDNDSTAVLVARSIGSSDLTFTATDSAGNETIEPRTINVVEERSTGNSPPKFNQAALAAMLPANSTLTDGAFLELTLSDLYSDADGDDLTFTAMSSDTAVILATLEADGSTLVLLARGVGTATITLEATDSEGASTKNSFNLQVETETDSGNQAPVVDLAALAAALPADGTLQQGNYFEMKLDGLFSDPDGDEINLSVASSNASVLRVTATSDQSSAFLIARNVGSADLIFTATDSVDNTTVERERIRVVGKASGENRPPVVDQQALADALPTNNTLAVPEFFEIQLDDLFSDPDPGDKVAAFEATSSDEDVLLVLVDSYNLLTAFAREAGSARLSLTARDTHGAETQVSETIRVVAAAASALAFEQQTMDRNAPLAFDMAESLPDSVASDTNISLSATIQNENILQAQIDGLQIALTALNQGRTFVKLKVTSESGYSSNSMFFVDVVNATPRVLVDIGEQAIDRIDSTTIDLGSVFGDADGDTVSFHATVEDETIIAVDLIGDRLTLDGLSVGSSTVTVHATDEHGASVSSTFNVVVENLAPTVLAPIGSIELEVGGEPYLVNYTKLFVDRDDALSFSSNLNVPDIVALTDFDDGAELIAMKRGEVKLTITATDAHGASASIETDVVASNDNLHANAQATLAGFGRSLMSSSSAVVEKRASLSRVSGDLETSNAQSEVLRSFQTNQSPALASQTNWGSISETQIGTQTQIDAFGSTALANPLAHGFSFDLGNADGTSPWSVWSSTDHQSFSNTDHRGDIANTYLGIDKEFGDAWLYGLSISQHRGDATYQYGAANRELRLQLKQLMPYVRVNPSSKTTIWSGLAIGYGELTTSPLTSTGTTSDLRSHMATAGGSYKLAERATYQFGFRGDVATQRLATTTGAVESANLTALNHRIRAGVDGEWSIHLTDQFLLTPFGQVNLRSDEGNTVARGIEVEGGAKLTHPWFTVELRSRSYQANGHEALSEKGHALTATINPSSNGAGISASIAPRWGADIQSNRSIWLNTPLQAQTNGSWSNQQAGMQVDSRLGYGFLLANEQFLLMPFVQQSRTDGGTNRSQFGLQLKQLSRSNMVIDSQLAAAKHETRTGEQNHSIGFSVRLSL